MAELAILAPRIEERPKRFRLEATRAWWDAAALVPPEPPTRVLDPPVLDLEAYRLGRRLLFRGRLIGRFELVCGRCTEPYALELEEPVELLLEPAVAGTEIEGGIQLDPEDLSLGRYAGDELDFAPVLVEALLTSWPMQPRCTETCRGLCPACGGNLNAEACACDTSGGNRPFEALRELIQPGQRDGEVEGARASETSSGDVDEDAAEDTGRGARGKPARGRRGSGSGSS